MTPRPAELGDFRGYLALLKILDPQAPGPDRARWERDFLPGLFVVGGPAGPVGCVYFDVFDDAAYVHQLIVLPHVRRTGVARSLMRALAQQLAARGVRYWDLNVVSENIAAIRLYESLGMVAVGETSSIRFDWSIVERLPTTQANVGVVARELEREQEREVETRFGLRAGCIDVRRRKLGRRVISLFESERPVGVAVFAPALPSTVPFAVARPELVGPLLLALRPLADRRLDYSLVAISDDPESIGLLLEHGAETYMRTARYTGSLTHPALAS